MNTLDIINILFKHCKAYKIKILSLNDDTIYMYINDTKIKIHTYGYGEFSVDEVAGLLLTRNYKTDSLKKFLEDKLKLMQ